MPFLLCLVETKTQTYHGRFGAGRRTAGQRGGAGTGRTGRRRVVSTRIQPSLLRSKQSKKTFLGVSLEARTYEILCKPMGEQNQRLNCGTMAALRSWLLTNVPNPRYLCKLFSCKACPGKGFTNTKQVGPSVSIRQRQRIWSRGQTAYQTLVNRTSCSPERFT